jgi:hypothetical protein
MVGIVINLLLRLGVNSHEFWQETIIFFNEAFTNCFVPNINHKYGVVVNHKYD